MQGVQRRHQHVADMGGEGGPICHRQAIAKQSAERHRALDHPGRDQRISRQAGNECLRAPVSERRTHLQPLPARATSPEAREVRLYGRFINENKSSGLRPHSGHATRQPILARAPCLGTPALRGHQRLFCM